MSGCKKLKLLHKNSIDDPEYLLIKIIELINWIPWIPTLLHLWFSPLTVTQFDFSYIEMASWNMYAKNNNNNRSISNHYSHELVPSWRLYHSNLSIYILNGSNINQLLKTTTMKFTMSFHYVELTTSSTQSVYFSKPSHYCVWRFRFISGHCRNANWLNWFDNDFGFI